MSSRTTRSWYDVRAWPGPEPNMLWPPDPENNWGPPSREYPYRSRMALFFQILDAHRDGLPLEKYAVMASGEGYGRDYRWSPSKFLHQIMDFSANWEHVLADIRWPGEKEELIRGGMTSETALAQEQKVRHHEINYLYSRTSDVCMNLYSHNAVAYSPPRVHKPWDMPRFRYTIEAYIEVFEPPLLYRTKTIALRSRNAHPFVTLGNWADCLRDAGVDMLQLSPYYQHPNGMWQQMSWWDHLYGTPKQGRESVVTILICPRWYNPWGGSLSARLHNVSAADLRLEPTGEEITVCVQRAGDYYHPSREPQDGIGLLSTTFRIPVYRNNWAILWDAHEDDRIESAGLTANQQTWAYHLLLRWAGTGWLETEWTDVVPLPKDRGPDYQLKLRMVCLTCYSLVGPSDLTDHF